MPKALFDAVVAAQNFNSGYATTEYLEASMIDQAWHQIAAAATPPPPNVMAFERAALSKDHVLYPPIPPRYHTPYFLHVFAGIGYAASYYAYIWSEVLARDTGHWFHTHGGISRANGDFFRAKILSRGRTKEPDVLFREFYGGPPEIGPLLEYRGLLPAKTAAR
jgi:peptidyl-dipeptidase Dcp